MSINHNDWRETERRSEESNRRCPFAYQPYALPLGQTSLSNAKSQHSVHKPQWRAKSLRSVHKPQWRAKWLKSVLKTQCRAKTKRRRKRGGQSYLTGSISYPTVGAGIAQWLEHRTRDWKVAGSNPCWNGGRIFFSRVDFLCWLLFRYPFHPRVTTVARNPGHSAKSAGGRLQLNTHTPYVCGFYWTVLRHWSQLVPNMSNDIWGH